MTEFLEVRDGSRRIAFEGTLIAYVTSAGGSKSRWSEYSLYRTVTGVYVLQKVGFSLVVHMPSCHEIVGSLNRFQEENPGRDPMDGWWLCESCCTKSRGPVDITALLVENDRYWATTSENPDRIVDALFRRKEGARHLPRLSIELLEQAARVDSKIAEAFRIERI